MPRQIIDTESSRPAYVRRRIAADRGYPSLIFLLLAAAVWFLARRTVGQETRPTGGTWLRSAVV